MQQLVKPAEYAKMHGLSRQSVYAKIKRGTLPSRKVDGRYYVIVAESIDQKSTNNQPADENIEHVSLIDEYRELIKAKDETIEVLKSSIKDLKAANEQITQTLQQEITLLKQAFYEMKAIYQQNYLLTQTTSSSPAKSEEVIETQPYVYETDKKKPLNKRAKEQKREKKGEEECWIPLGDLIQRKQFSYNKAKQVVKRFKKAYKKGDRRIKKENGIYYIFCYDFYEDILE